MKLGSHVLGHFRLEQLLEQRGGASLYLADNEKREELVLLILAPSAQSLAACLAHRADGEVLAQMRSGEWHAAEVRLDENHLHTFADKLLAATAETADLEPASTEARLENGSVFAGRYRIDGFLGRGGMGTVYRAYDSVFERDVALKVLRVDEYPAERESAPRRLLHEARVVSALEHPHIVSIHHAAENEGLPYLVLELCDGGNLRTAEGASQEERLRWLTEMAEALAHAHDQGIVHRDIKPENVLLTRDGKVKIADFGIAKALAGDSATTTLGFAGTPRYMAPEQLFGDPVDARADQFAWGLVAYELLTGSHPRMRRTATGIAPVPAHRLRVIERAMASAPRARYCDFHALLDEWRGTAPRKRRAPWAAALVVVAAMAASPQETEWPREAAAQTEDDGVAAQQHETNPVARAHFEAAMGLWRDMSLVEARASFVKATEADAAFARAHLYHVLVFPPQTDAVRMHYRAALDHRHTLDATDTLTLDALGPAMQDPADLPATEQRLTELLAKSGSFFVASALSHVRLQLGRPREALEVVRHLRHPDESPAFEARTAAMVALAESRVDDARRALGECITRSPRAAVCLRLVTMLHAFDGSCGAAEQSSRQWITASPDSAEAHQWLAGAIYARTKSAESAHAELQRGWAKRPEGVRPRWRAAETTYLALLRGDVDHARRSLDDWEQLASLASDEYVRGLPASVRLDLEYDLGPPDRVRTLAHRYLSESAVWTDSPWLDFRAIAARAQLRVGGMSEDELVFEREKWLAADRQHSDEEVRRWFRWHAIVGVTPRLAADAIAHIPADRPFADPSRCDNDCEATLGETFFVAGNPARARSHLERASNACTLQYPLQSLRARHLLGRTLESLGRGHEACTAYRRIVTEWPRVHASRIVRHAKARVAALRCHDS